MDTMECCSSSQPLDLFTLPQQSSSSTSGTPKITRKRKRNPDLWKKSVAKAKRARGETYLSSTTGKEVAAVCQGGPCSCKKLCYSKFTDDERQRIFTLFWELGDKSIQDAYLHGLIRVRKIARRRARKSAEVKSRSASFIYVVSHDNYYKCYYFKNLTYHTVSYLDFNPVV